MASMWLLYVIALACMLASGGAVPVFFAVAAIAFRVWAACKTSLGLVAQRLFTVSTGFASARARAAREVAGIGGRKAPADETWFEVVLDITLSAREGGPIAL